MHVTLIGQVDPHGTNMGGIEVHLNELNRHLEARGIDTLVLGWTRRRCKDDNFVPILRNKKLTGIRYLISLILKAPFVDIPENSIIHGHRPDHILPFIWRKNAIICTLHGAHILNVELKWGRLAEFIYSVIQAIALKRADLIIYVSEWTRRFFHRRYPFLVRKKYAVISPGVKNTFRPSDEKGGRGYYLPGITENDRLLIYVGRLEKEKKIDRLIEQVKGSRFQLLIVGEGREEEKLRKAAEGYPNIRFTGCVSHEEVPSLINAAAAAVLLSEYEGMPIFVLESLACGKPVLSSDVGDIRGLILDGKTGYIVNEANFMRYAKKLFSEDYNRFRKNCLAAVKEHMWDLIGDKIIQAYKALGM